MLTHLLRAYTAPCSILSFSRYLLLHHLFKLGFGATDSCLRRLPLSPHLLFCLDDTNARLARRGAILAFRCHSPIPLTYRDLL